MSGVAPVSGVGYGLPSITPAQTGAITESPSGQAGLAAGASGLAAGASGSAASVASSQSLAAYSSMSISAANESVFYQSSPILADKQALGLAVLMLTLEYLQSNDDEEKKGLLALMLALTQQQSGQQETLMYSSSSLSIESTQYVGMSSDSVANAYSGSAGAVQGLAATDGGMGQLSVVA